jgi:hypothetical protein
MSGPNQTVSVKSKPDGAKFSFLDKKGVAVAAGNTPMTVTLKRRHDYVLKVEKEQFEPIEIPVEGGVNGWYLGNVLFGGVLGLLIVDPATGAMWSLSPDDVTVEMASAGSGQKSVLLVEPRLTAPRTTHGAEFHMHKGK